MKRISIKLTGVTREDAQENIKALASLGMLVQLTLKREPDNPKDPNAIRVKYESRYLGYIPAREAVRLAPLLDEGIPLMAVVVRINDSAEHETVGLTIEINAGHETRARNVIEARSQRATKPHRKDPKWFREAVVEIHRLASGSKE